MTISLLPRLDGGGIEVIANPPAGCIYQVDPDGKHWDLVSIGFRNQYDAAGERRGRAVLVRRRRRQDLEHRWYSADARLPRRERVGLGLALWKRSGRWPTPDTLPSVIDVWSRFADRYHIRIRREVSGPLSTGLVSERLDLWPIVRRSPEPTRRLVRRYAAEIRLRPPLP